MSKKTLPSNYADQHNPNNSAYWKGRGYEDRPADWPSRDALHQPTVPTPTDKGESQPPEKR